MAVCIPLPSPPPAPTPAPTPAPSPGPTPAPTPAPTPPPIPTPPPLPPDVPVGVPQIVVDMANSYINPDLFCFGTHVALTGVGEQNGVFIGTHGTLTLTFQNLSATPGTAYARCTVDNGNLVITPTGIQTVPIAGHNFAQVNFDLHALSGASDAGTYVITVETGTGTFSFNVVLQGDYNCDAAGGA